MCLWPRPQCLPYHTPLIALARSHDVTTTLKPCSSHAMANGERNSYGRFSDRLLSKALHCISTLSHHPHTPTEPSGAFRASVSRATTARDQTTDNLISGRSALRPAPLMHLKDHYTYLALESKPVQQNQISSSIPHISLPWFKKKTNRKQTWQLHYPQFNLNSDSWVEGWSVSSE